MASYSYKREESARLEPGDYRVSIVSVEEKVSRSGKNMVVLGVRPNGTNLTINHYIVEGDYWNRNLTQLFDSFNIPEGEMNLMTWPGAVGAARIKIDDQGYLKVAYFIRKKKAEELPPWVGAMPERQTVNASGFADVTDDEKLPWEE